MNASTPRSFVVTGASTGIGQACVQHLSGLGHRVFAGVRKAADADRLRRAHARVTPVQFDVRDAAALRRAADEVAQAVGAAGLHGLVNNAGVAVAAPLEYLPPDDLREQLDINVVGQLAVTQAFLPLLRQGPPGRVVFISSVSGLMATPMVGAYCASKFALEALADAWRLELREWGIPVSLVEPGQIATPIWDTASRAADERVRRMPPEASTRYAWLTRAMRVSAGHGAKHGLDPQQVAQAVHKALLDARPQPRYLVGKEGPAVRVLNRLPTGLRDRLILAQMRKMAAGYREP